MRGYHPVIASSRRLRGNPEKIIKKCYKIAFLTGLLRQLLRNFLAMTKNQSTQQGPNHTTRPLLARYDID
ncbi:hypothetical protein [Rickettsia hoogstraalii]|uniref:hypothetical protein n=1 Tax=Rickettsia hoogstraalii TaxID=467174 RepID=UPI000AB8C807|nr:hypothetical protein [Rickettsia hoogstraalii]